MSRRVTARSQASARVLRVIDLLTAAADECSRRKDLTGLNAAADTLGRLVEVSTGAGLLASDIGKPVSAPLGHTDELPLELMGDRTLVRGE